MKLSRDEAVEKLGGYITISGHMGVFGYQDEKTIKSLLYDLRRGVGDDYYHINISHEYGAIQPDASIFMLRSKISKSISEYDSWLDDFMDFSMETLDIDKKIKRLRDIVKIDLVSHAVAIHRQGKLSKIFNGEKSEAGLRAFYDNHPAINEYVQRVGVKFHPFPSEVNVKSPLLNKNSKIYFVDFSDISGDGSKILEGSMSNVNVDHEYEEGKIDSLNVVYISKFDGVNDVDFKLTVDGKIEVISDKQVSKNMFLNLDDAREFDASMWGKIIDNSPDCKQENPVIPSPM